VVLSGLMGEFLAAGMFLAAGKKLLGNLLEDEDFFAGNKMQVSGLAC
jgi:hypothetical protein